MRWGLLSRGSVELMAGRDRSTGSPSFPVVPRPLLGSFVSSRGPPLFRVLPRPPAGPVGERARELVCTLVSAESRQAMWSPKPELSLPGYGYGFQVGGTPEDRVVGHGGGFPGISSNLDLFVDSGYTSIVLTNVDQGAPPVAQKIVEMVGRLEAAGE